jgi:hypothetical protein
LEQEQQQQQRQQQQRQRQREQKESVEIHQKQLFKKVSDFQSRQLFLKK